ncbi:hypothetical protein HOLleu_32765 [Holothuria leucospilota]|uniref:Uncharacterized protein n=1 Tax=Holothuria leucospilota TaxID=206669 RepID=A0A9Q1GXL6_HOLLE|nr:hypothetical protein HOLleu_32765 [Holothuria leucospilota]
MHTELNANLPGLSCSLSWMANPHENGTFHSRKLRLPEMNETSNPSYRWLHIAGHVRYWLSWFFNFILEALTPSFPLHSFLRIPDLICGLPHYLALFFKTIHA